MLAALKRAFLHVGRLKVLDCQRAFSVVRAVMTSRSNVYMPVNAHSSKTLAEKPAADSHVPVRLNTWYLRWGMGN